jgi:hypothetical protein
MTFKQGLCIVEGACPVELRWDQGCRRLCDIARDRDEGTQLGRHRGALGEIEKQPRLFDGVPRQKFDQAAGGQRLLALVKR